MNVVEAAQFPEKEYINRIFLAVLEIYEKGGSAGFSEYKCSRTAQVATTGRKDYCSAGKATFQLTIFLKIPVLV
jgi:hypothetical protein